MLNNVEIQRESYWTVESVISDPNRYYIFGDNEEGWGTGGQACIRGLPNAYGIPTKKSPFTYWSDHDYIANISAIDLAISKIPADKPWVISVYGLGTGLAKLPLKAPRTYKYLCDKLGI